MAKRRSFLVEELAREEASLAYIRTLASARGRAGEWVVTGVLAQLRAELAWLDAVIAEGARTPQRPG